MSALPPKADINRGERYVCFVPIADIDAITSSEGKHARRNGETKRLGSTRRNLGLPGVDTEDDKTPH